MGDYWNFGTKVRVRVRVRIPSGYYVWFKLDNDALGIEWNISDFWNFGTICWTP